MKSSVIRHGLFGVSVLLLLSGCASVVFPLQQEKPTDTPAAENSRIASSADALAQYSMGILEGSGGNSEESLRRYEAAVKADPDNLTIRTELAVSYFHQNRLSDMAATLDEVLRRDPDNLRALQLKALNLRIQGNYQEALIPLQRAAKIEPAESSHYMELASVYSRLDEIDEALTALEKGLPLVNDRLSIFQAMGELYITQAASIRAKKRNAPLPKSPLEMMVTALESFPEDPYLLTQYGDLLILHREVEKAIEVFGRIEELNPDDIMIRQKLALNLAAIGNRGKAIELLEDISTKQPGNTRLLFYLAELYELDKQSDKAIATFQRILKIKPTSAEAYIKQAFLCISQDQWDAAMDVLQTATNRVPGDVRLIELLGYTYAAMTNHADAIAQFDRVQEGLTTSGKKPLLSNFYLNYAISRQFMDQYEQAAQLVRKAMEDNPEAIDDYMAISLRSPDKAVRLPATISVLELVQDVIPDSPSTRTLYGLLAFRADDFETALTQFERAERLTIENGDEEELTSQFYFWLGASAERIKEYEKSEQYFMKAVQMQPDYAEARNYLSFMLAERGIKLDEAYDHVDVALAIEPDNAAYIDTRGWIYFKRGEYDKARIDIERAMELMPDDPTIIDHMGDIEFATGNTEEALSWWKKSIELEPSNELIREKIRSLEAKSVSEPVTPN